jgi:galactokinase
VSISELDLAVEIAIGAGALGARMTGGGFGGAAIALTPKALANQVSQAISAAFTKSNFAQPHIFSVYADDGAGRES